MTWYDIRNPNDPELDRLAELYHLHPLHIEDCRHRNENAKVEDGPGYLFVIIKPVKVHGDGTLEFVDLDLFVGKDFLITVEEDQCPLARKTLDEVHAAANGQPPNQLFYRILDRIVDGYLPIVDRYDNTIDALEDAVL